MSTAVVILAAGKGTRMKTGAAKVLHRAAGRSLLEWALEEAASVAPEVTVTVVGHQSDAVAAACPAGVVAVQQEPQLGTAHAVQMALPSIPSDIDTVVVLPGDMPLIRGESLQALVAEHSATGSAATVMSVVLEDPSGYGRIVRSDGAVTSIVEHRDADDDQLKIREVNTSVYVFDRARLADAISRVTADNAQSEYYLPDVIGILASDGHTVGAVVVGQEEGVGVNDHAQLADVDAELRRRINLAHMVAGVAIPDPATVYIEPTVRIEPGATIHPQTHLVGTTVISAGASVGPGSFVTDSLIGEDAVVRYSTLHEAEVGKSALVGPYSYLRPGAVLREGAKAGAFVEIKGSVVGKNSKVPHLSYIGDAEIGENSNIGAATVTVNYDGREKHRTTVGDNVRVGSDTMLVAPVTIGDNAFTGAGSVITEDVPEGALGIERSDQRNIEGYAEKRRKRAGEKAD